MEVLRQRRLHSTVVSTIKVAREGAHLQLNGQLWVADHTLFAHDVGLRCLAMEVVADEGTHLGTMGYSVGGVAFRGKYNLGCIWYIS